MTYGSPIDCESQKMNKIVLSTTVAAVTPGIFCYTPEPHVAFCPIFVHPFFQVFEPHFQKWVIFVRRRPCVCDTFRFESPPLRGKKIEFGNHDN